MAFVGAALKCHHKYSFNRFNWVYINTLPQNLGVKKLRVIGLKMKQDLIYGYWHEIKGKIRHQWGNITDNDLLKMKGSLEELSGVIQQRHGYKKDQAQKEILEFLKKNNIVSKE